MADYGQRTFLYKNPYSDWEEEYVNMYERSGSGTFYSMEQDESENSNESRIATLLNVDRDILNKEQGESNLFQNYINIDVEFIYTDTTGSRVITTIGKYFDLHNVVYTDEAGNNYAKWNFMPVYKKNDETLTLIPGENRKSITLEKHSIGLTFPTIILPISQKQAIGWGDRTLIGYRTNENNQREGIYAEECKDLADKQGIIHGYKPPNRDKETGYQSSQDTWMQTDYYKYDDTPLGHPKYGKTFENNLFNNIIKGIASLENGVGFVIGMGGTKNVDNTNKSTSHFVYVYGVGTDAKGERYFLFADNGRINHTEVLSSSNQVYLKYNQEIGYFMYSNKWGYVTEFRISR